jgi:hypothetical protein
MRPPVLGQASDRLGIFGIIFGGECVHGLFGFGATIGHPDGMQVVLGRFLAGFREFV